MQTAWQTATDEKTSQLVLHVACSMVPHKTKRGAAALDRMKTFEGVPPPYDKVKRMVIPDALKVLRLQHGHKYCKLGDLSNSVSLLCSCCTWPCAVSADRPALRVLAAWMWTEEACTVYDWLCIAVCTCCNDMVQLCYQSTLLCCMCHARCCSTCSWIFVDSACRFSVHNLSGFLSAYVILS